MRLTYQQQLVGLDTTYRRSLQLDVRELTELHAANAGQPTLFVASGGGLAPAQVAADRHSATHGELGVAMTPLALVGEATVRRAAVVAISARAAHPDVGFALRAARLRHNYPVSLVTHRAIEDLDPALVQRLSSIVHVPILEQDGFLATNSVLSLATLFTRASDLNLNLPSTLPWMTNDAPTITTSQCLVLYGPGQRAAAIDLETRLYELGLVSVQVTDYRNFAHGRHTGFARNQAHTTVVSFASPRTAELANATLALLPQATTVIRLHSSLPEPSAALDLLVASMRVAGTTADRAGVNPAHPKVPIFGRRLYHLGAHRHLVLEEQGPIERKLAALGVAASNRLYEQYSDAFHGWMRELQALVFRAVVIDYDGTVCATRDRFGLPTTPVRDKLIQLLEDGMQVGFATGRGRSLHADLRQWIPTHLWPNVTLGLYNGSLVIDGLNMPVPEQEAVSPHLETLMARFGDEPLSTLMKVEARPQQVSIEPVTGTGIGIEAAAGWISECVARAPRLPLKSFRSGHSVDVVATSTSKVAVLEHLESHCNGPVLAIGDRGDIGGNDFELLAARRWSITVDRSSGDQTRCWNVAPAGASGPDALAAYLRWLKPWQSGWRFRPTTR